jgi:hypothetical protein
MILSLPLAAILAEAVRELEARQSAYPGLVAKLRMSEAEATHGIAMATAWVEDARRWSDWLALPAPRPAFPHQERTRGFTWAQRIAAVEQEQARRAALYPGWIAKLMLTREEAGRRNQALAALHEGYEQGWDWHDPYGRRPDFHTEADTPEIREINDLWMAYVVETLNRRAGVVPQQELVL